MIKKLLKKIFRKIKRFFGVFGRKRLLAAAVAIAVMSCALTWYHYVETNYINSMTLTLNYANGRNGLNPEGGRFNIADIKSDEVIEGAIHILNDDSLSAEAVKSRIGIDTVMPKSAVENTISAIADNATYSYSPSEFDIYYSQENKFKKNRSSEFLTALSQSYKNYFNKNYAPKNDVLQFKTDDNFSDCDYNEQYTIVYDKLASMLRYLDKRASADSNFRSEKTGYTFANLVTLLNNIRDVDLEKLNSYIIQNGVTRDKDEYINKTSYLSDKSEVQYKTLNSSSIVGKTALELYEPRMLSVVFIPSVDSADEYYMGRTKTGLDLLIKDSYDDSQSALNIKKDRDRYQYLINKYSAISNEGEAGNSLAETTESMIEDICGEIKKISDLAIETDNEYANQKFGNYITFYYHSQSVVPTAIYFVKITVVLAVLSLLLMVFYVKKKDKYIGLIKHVCNKIDSKLSEE